MDDRLFDLDFRPQLTADRPLAGLTILVVEDSRYASEAMRLMSLRSGARIRRADCIASAERHLNVYRPAIAIVDLGLPDGSGLELIATMARTRPRVPIILGTSGAEPETAEKRALVAGANGFLAKPVASLAVFQQAILAHLPPDLCPQGPRALPVAETAPDRIALREDLTAAMDLLALEAPPVSYLRTFLVGLARSSRDGPLEDRALSIGDRIGGSDRADLRAFLSQRIQAMPMMMH